METGGMSGFGPCAMIMTTDGPLPVEWLEAGDRVITRDHGAQPVVCIKHTRGTGPGGLPLPEPLHLQPQADMAQSGLYEPLRLSPHHRVLVCAPLVELLFGTEEVMAEIGALSRRGAVRAEPGAPPPRYHHIILEHHALIHVCGIWAESTGYETAATLDVTPAERRASTVFDAHSVTPRMCLHATEAQLLRHMTPPEQSLVRLLAA